MDMPGMSGGAATTTASSSAAAMTMAMTMQSVFQNVRSTPLYSTSWTPGSTGAYAGTCIFLIVLAATMRALLVGRTYLEALWLDRELNRRYVFVAGGGKLPLAQRLSHDASAKHVVLSENGVEEDVVVVSRKDVVVRPWRLTTDPLRAVLDMVITGIGYLL